MSESAKRTLRVAKALRGRSLDGLSVIELAKGLNETSVNVCRALTDLVEEGFVVKLDSGRYAHSHQMIALAESHRQGLERARGRIDEQDQRRLAAGYTS